MLIEGQSPITRKVDFTSDEEADMPSEDVASLVVKSDELLLKYADSEQSDVAQLRQLLAEQRDALKVLSSKNESLVQKIQQISKVKRAAIQIIGQLPS